MSLHRAIVILNTGLQEFDLHMEIDEEAIAKLVGEAAILAIGREQQLMNGAIKFRAVFRGNEPKSVIATH